MKKLLVLLFIIVCGYAKASDSNDIQSKALAIATKYQSVTGINATQFQQTVDLLTVYFTDRSNGATVSASVKAQVSEIISASETGTGGPLTASTALATANGTLSASDPTFNRTTSTSYNISCITQGELSGTGTNVYYDTIEFTVTQAGIFDIEVTDFNSNTDDDSFLSLYCHFNSSDSRENLIMADDDGGADMLSMFEDIALPLGTYYLIMTSFDNGETGDYSIEFRSNTGKIVLGNNPVPVNNWWIAGLFVLIGAGILLKKLF